MDAGGGGADDGEDTASLAETTTFPAARPQPPPGKQIRPEEEVSVGSTNRFLTHRGQGSMRILPVVNAYFSAHLHVITHTLAHVPACSPSEVASCQSPPHPTLPLLSSSLAYFATYGLQTLTLPRVSLPARNIS